MNGVVCVYCCGAGGVEYAHERLREDTTEIDMHIGLHICRDPITGSSTQHILDAVKRIPFTSTTLVRGIR
jgi:hypothetical protein